MTELLTAIGEVIWSLALLTFAIGFLFLIKPIRGLVSFLVMRGATHRLAVLIRAMNEAMKAEVPHSSLLPSRSRQETQVGDPHESEV